MIIGKENTTINVDTLVSGHIHNINNADESYSVVKVIATNIDRTTMLIWTSSC